MSTTASALEIQTFTITEDIDVHASIEQTFKSLIAQIGRLTRRATAPRCRWSSSTPGGRWYRDLGGDDGHLWGFVQSIKRPTLLEIWGPLFMSTGATSNMMYRLSETPEGTLIKFRHTVVGPFPEENRPSASGWSAMHARVRKAAEAAEN